MFATHQPLIQEYAARGPDELARVITFVYLTVQQSIFDVPDLMRDVDERGRDSPYIWGFKINAFDWLQEHKVQLYTDLLGIYHGHADPDDAEFELIKYLAGCPGMGLVKGGFAAQLMFGLGGCIDTHNLRLYGLDARDFKASRFKMAKIRRRAEFVRSYQRLCASLGGPAILWDNWCEYVAERNHTTAVAVSALHTEAIL